ncbi:MAG TPA: M23 family metallopeptidase [Longimicrobiaceae bacterium]|nr:M23 family metallopeptidase [Longimicrobiaceae bacterium]
MFSRSISHLLEVVKGDKLRTRARRVQRVRGVVTLAAAAALGLGAAGLRAAERPETAPAAPLLVLPAEHAVGMRVDTLFLGGYASGSFTDALHVLASDLSPDEREMVGRHLDRIFAGVVPQGGLGDAGRLRVAYERTVRPDGTTRSIRVLTAEAAVGGELHTAYYYEPSGKPGYYDPFGRSLDRHEWTSPLAIALRITSGFSTRRIHPILHRLLPHTGVDYAAAIGTPAHATADGMVVWAARRGGYGNMVEIQHPNGYSTRYAHLSRIASGVVPGRFVRQGEVIGYVGMTGLATGPHLHYEVRRNGRPVDPLRVGGGPGPAGEIGADAGWSEQRMELAHLLARTPTELRTAMQN